jgi:hypothetical protein
MTPRNSYNGRVVEGTIVDNQAAAGSSSGNPPEATTQEVLQSLQQVAGLIAAKQKKAPTDIKEAIAKSMRMRDAANKFPNPADTGITIGHSGILRTENPQDRALADADRLNKNLAYALAHLVALLGQYEVSGKKFVMEAVNQLIIMADEYPEYMQPISELLDEQLIPYLTGTFTQGAEMLSVRGLEGLARATVIRRRQAN